MSDNRAASYYKEALTGAGFRGPRGYPVGARGPVRMTLLGTITDNAVTFVDLTASVANIDILRAAGQVVDSTGSSALSPVTDPSAVVVIEAAAFVPLTVAETHAATMQTIARSVLVHAPGGASPREVSLIDIYDSAVQTASIAVGPLNVSGIKRVETTPLRLGPMWVDMQRDTFGIKPLVATDLVANLDFLLVIDGAAFPNAGWTPNDAGDNCNDTPERMKIRLQRAPGERAKIRSVFGGGLTVIPPQK